MSLLRARRSDSAVRISGLGLLKVGLLKMGKEEDEISEGNEGSSWLRRGAGLSSMAPSYK